MAEPRRFAALAAALLVAAAGGGCREPDEAPPPPPAVAAALAAPRQPPASPQPPPRRLPGSAQATRPAGPPLVLPPLPELGDEVPVDEALIAIYRRLELLQARSEAPAAAPPPEVPRRRLTR